MIDPGALEEDHSPRPPSPPVNLVGTILAERYQILKCIAEGGMGMVYLAEHITIGRRLAVKVLSADLGNTPEVVQRFLGEARAASMIQHEHIVDIIDFGYTAQGQAFLAMEFLEGEDLATTLDREKRLPWHRLRRMVLQMCRALNAAHEKGVIHRDMKPDNCFRIKRGGNADFIKLLDFGIAKVMTEATTSRGRAPQAPSATAAGTLLGTPEYMAPELARDGAPPDARVDVYSLGIMMYELLTGVVPFKGETFMSTIAKHLTEEPIPPRQRAPDADIPPPIEAVILKAMAKDPAERFQSIREMTEAIVAADKRLRSTGLLLQAIPDSTGPYPTVSSDGFGSGEIPPGVVAAALETTPVPSGPPTALPRAGITIPPSSALQATGAHAIEAAGIMGAPIAAPATHDEALDALEDARPNPWRWLSAVLAIVVVGLGVVMWQFMQQGGPGEPTRTTAEPPAGSGSKGAEAASAGPRAPETPPPTTQGGGEAASAGPTASGGGGGGEEPVTDPLFGALKTITDDERRAIQNDLQELVRRCARSHGIRAQDQKKVRVVLRAEAGTGKLGGDLPTEVINTLFGTCIVKAIQSTQFEPGRKAMRFDYEFSP